MPRLTQFQRWFFRTVAYRAALTLVALALLAPRALLAVAPGGGVMRSPSHVSSSSRAAKRSTSARSRFSYVTITHNGNGTASVYTYASGSTTFTVRNDGAPLTALFSASICTGNISNCSASPSGTYLSTGASTTVTVSFTAGATAGQGQLRLTARDASDNSVMNYYDISVTVSVDPNAPTLSFSPHLGDRRDVSQCVADCFESTLSFTTPPYISLDVPRSATLLYRSGSAYPQGKLTLDANAPTAPAGSTFRLQLVDQNAAYVPFSNGTTALYFARNTTGPTRIVAQFDATQIPTSARLYSARVSTIKSDGTVFGTAVASVRIIAINDQNSPYGAGVSLVGVQRILFNQSDGVLVTDGTGSATFFSGTCDVNTTCTYTSPSGEFSTLSTNAGWFYRTYPDGTQLRYYPDGHHFTTVDRFGSTTQVNYGYNGPYADYFPLSITDPSGQSISFGYRDANWLYGWKLGSLGNIHTPAGDAPIAIDGANNAVQWVELGGGTYRWRMTYLAQHQLDTAFAKDSSVWKHVYRYGATLAYRDAPAIKIDSGVMRNPRITLRNTGDALLLGGAASGGGSSYTTPLAVLTDARAIVIGPRNDSTLYSLNSFGAPQKTYAPLMPVDSAEYNAAGQVVRTISPTGMDMRYTWSAEKLIKVQNVTQGSQDSIVYATQFSLPAQIISSNSPGLWYMYDQAKTGWPLQTTRIGSSTATPTTHYADAKGRDTAVVDPGGHWTKQYYAAAGLQNTDSVRSPNGTLTRIGRDGWGRVISTTDPYGSSTIASLDTLNRPRWIARPATGDTTRFQYDLLNNVRSVTDAKNQVYTYQVNALGWVTAAVSPGASIGDSTRYDVAGNPTYLRTRAGRRDSLVYDALGRVTKKFGLGDGDAITYTYDPNLRWVKALKMSGGTFVSMDSIATDSVGRKTQESAYRPNRSYLQQYSFQADKPDRTFSSLNDGGLAYRSIQFTYDAAKRLSQIEVLGGGISTFGYDGENLPTTVQFPSGLTQTTSYTSSHALARRQYSLQAVKDSFDRSYRTDSLARVVERANGSGTKYQTFMYNMNNRLATWEKRHKTGTITCGSLGDWGYNCSGISVADLSAGFYYDVVGNPTDAGATLDPGNRLRTFNGDSMLYDADGNVARRKIGTTTDSLLWDDFGELKEVRRNGTTIATFAYDGFGRRTRKTAGGTTTQYLWDGDQLRAEASGTDTTTQTYSYYPGIDQLHAVTKNGVTYYASIEPSTGDVTGLINGSTNAVVATYSYTPWGEIESSTETISGLNSLRWKGLLYDTETGLYYMRARYYDPRMRRFISEDPLGLAGGINQFAFVENDPVNNSDPTGLETRCYRFWIPGAQTRFAGNVMNTEPGYWQQVCIQVADIGLPSPGRAYSRNIRPRSGISTYALASTPSLPKCMASAGSMSFGLIGDFGFLRGAIVGWGAARAAGGYLPDMLGESLKRGVLGSMSARFILTQNPGRAWYPNGSTLMGLSGRAAGGIVANESAEVVNQIAHDKPNVTGLFTTFIPIWPNFKPNGTIDTWLHDCTQ
jgi:RHS repeat-associated protein